MSRVASLVYFSQRVHVFPFVQHTRGQPQDVSGRILLRNMPTIPNFGNFLLIHVKAAVQDAEQVDRTMSRRREAHAGRLRLRSRMLGAHVRATHTHWTLYLTTARSNASADVQPTRASTTSLLHRSARARCAGRASAGQCRSSRVRSAPQLARSANESGCPRAPL